MRPTLMAYLQSFAPPESEPVFRTAENWWRQRVLDAVCGKEEPDETYWLIVFNGLITRWARASQIAWRGAEAEVIDAILGQIDHHIDWKEGR